MTIDIQPTETDMMTLCADFMYRSRFAKTEMCKEQPMSDNPPLMLIGYVSTPEGNPDTHDEAVRFANDEGLSRPYNIALVPLITKDDPLESFEEIVKSAPIRPFSFIAMVTEGYTREGEVNDESIANHVRGSLADDYKNNPFTKVREALTLCATDWELNNLYTIAQTFGYDDFGMPIFDDEQKVQISLGGFQDLMEKAEEKEMGRVPEALLAFTCFMHLAVTADGFSSLMKRAGEMKKKGE